jgi:hypothetical protein
MSINFNSGSWVPPTLSLRISNLSYQTRLLPPKLGNDVSGFAAQDEVELTQEQVDRAMARLQALIDSAPSDEQRVYALLIEQSQAHADEHWLTD